MTVLGDEIRKRLGAGQGYGLIIRDLGVASSTVAYHAKQLGINRNPNYKTYDWDEVQQFYDAGNSVAATRHQFGMSPNTMTEAQKRGAFKIDRGRSGTHRGLHLKQALCRESQSSTGTIKKIVLRHRLIAYACAGKKCPNRDVESPNWAGHALILHLDHINGIRNDHRLDNLRFLCPNCHSQTLTYCGRNKR